MPELRTYNPTWLASRPIAHRGLHGHGVPENSLAAFKAAAAAGYAIELDVQLSSDGQVVIFHDRAAGRRVTQSHVHVRSATAAELTKVRLLGTRHTVPLLADVLAAIRGRVPLAIEVKTDTPPGRIGPALVEMLAGYRGEVAVGSFDPRVLLWFRFHARQLPRVQIAGSLPEFPAYPRWARSLLRSMPLNFIIRPHALALDIRDYPTFSMTFYEHVLRIPVLLWVVKTQHDVKLADRDSRNIIFERLRPPAPRRP